MRAAQIVGGVVVNIIIVETEAIAQAFGAVLCPNFVNIGWAREDDVWIEPPQEEEPTE